MSDTYFIVYGMNRKSWHFSPNFEYVIKFSFTYILIKIKSLDLFNYIFCYILAIKKELRKSNVKSKLWLWIGLNVLLLHGCASTPKNHADSMQLFASPQDLIDQKQLNGATGISREYIYDWGQQPNIEPESLYPRKYLSQYCHANGGKFSVLRHSNLSLIKDHSTKKYWHLIQM